MAVIVLILREYSCGIASKLGATSLSRYTFQFSLVFFFLFRSGFFLHSVFRRSVYISKSLPVPRQRPTQFWRVVREAKGQVKDEWWNKGGLWIQTCTDSVSSLGGRVRAWVWEYSDRVFYLDVLISSCLQALSCDNPDVWRDSCSLQSKEEKKQQKNPHTISRHWFV